MADKSPLKATYSGSDTNGLAEFASGDTVAIADGGTGATTASGARTALGVSPTAGSSSLTTLGTISTGVWEATDVAIAHGGTGASTASAALTALGASPTAGSSSITTLGTIATGTWEATDIAIAHGGTGASTASQARTNLGITDTTPGGSNTQIQYNNSGAFGGSANLTFDGNDLFIADGGGMVIGHTSQLSPVGYPPELQVLGTGDADSQVSLGRWSNSSSGCQMSIVKSRGTTVGATGIVQDDDQLGLISWQGDDGTTTDSIAASIDCFVDGTPGVNQMPGRLEFMINSGASGTGPTTRMKIDSAGGVKLNNAGQDWYYAGSQTVGTSYEDVDTSLFPTFLQRDRAYLLYWVSYANHNGDTSSRQYGIAWVSGNAHGGSTNWRATVTVLGSNTSGYHGYANLTFANGGDGNLDVKRSSSSQQSYVNWWVQNACNTGRV